MLKAISHPPCCAALVACQRMMLQLATWLCEPGTTSADITEMALQPPRMSSLIEARWLWGLLQKTNNRVTLLVHAQAIADLNAIQKGELRAWLEPVSNVAAQFQAHPPTWPASTPNIPATAWNAFKVLMQAFYEKGLRGGLPYLEDGTPVATGGVSYATFLDDFRASHRSGLGPDADEVCVFCGGPLSQTPQIDHWIDKADFPLLSVCGDNLTPVCGTCNSPSYKGQKPVHSGGNFTDWFHPYLRPAEGKIVLNYSLPQRVVTCSAIDPGDEQKAKNLDQLLALSARWTQRFKAEYLNRQDTLIRREKRLLALGEPRQTARDILDYAQTWALDLNPNAPHYEVHQLLGQAMTTPALIKSWEDELSKVT